MKRGEMEMLKINCNNFLLALAKAEMTTTELHIKSGVGRNTISKLMNAETNVRPQLIGKIARALNVPIEDIIYKTKAV
jgi:transcriptional regulator with XRE-family HTH domain